MEEYLYRIKDMMDLFGITRDTIKYYEKKGLIKPKRTEAGYRLFDEFNIEKLKKILDLRDLGFSVNSIIKFIENDYQKSSGQNISELRMQLEEEIKILNKKLDKVRVYEKRYFENRCFYRKFNIEYNTIFCMGCPQLKNTDKCSFHVRWCGIFQTNNRGSILNEQSEYLVFYDEKMDIRCRGCEHEKKVYARVYRGIVPCHGKKELQRILWDVYENAENLGYQLSYKVYVTRKIITHNSTEELVYDIRIPIIDNN